MTTIPKQGPVIAIDGPAGTGKSSTTRKLSDTLGFTHIDTGALYRAIAFLLLEESGNDPARIHEDRATELARSVHLDFKRVAEKNPPNRVFANGRDVTEFIRTPIVSTVASRISAFSGVRSALLGLQRRMGCVGRTILEGRDIGTVIFPDADIKFFLTANVEERAKRRLAELEAAGSHALSFEVIKQQIIARDEGDSGRAVAPLKKADDAVELDTSCLTLDEVVREMERIVRTRLNLSLGSQAGKG